MTAVTGRRARWLVLAAWLVIAGVAGSFAGKFESIQKNEPSSFLPGNTDSLKALELSKRFPSGQSFAAIVAIRRDGGLTAADLRRIGGLRASLASRPVRSATGRPFEVVSHDRTTALVATNLHPGGSSNVLTTAVDDVRARGHALRATGLRVEVTGPAGFSGDAVKVFKQINGTLLYATAGLVFLLLILIYRSPIFWFIPLVSVAFAEVASRGLGYGLAEAGLTVNGQSAGILPVLVFGAGTDYALLLVARYREELRAHEDKAEAMRLALRRAGPAVFASGCTVMLALICLVFAQVNGTKGMGPIGAMGIAMAMASMLTLLPALLVICGRRAFWPFVPRFGTHGADETHGAWRRIGERVAAAPVRVLVAAVTLLAVLCVGLTSFKAGLPQDQTYRASVESVKGQKLIARAFPAGTIAQTNVITPHPERVAALAAALRRAPGVARVSAPEVGPPGARLTVVLTSEPYSNAAQDRIPGIRRVASAAGGPGTIVGGPTAEEKDLSVAAARDNRLIVPIVLVVVFLILALLLRAAVLPLVLIGTVILSFGAALGASSFAFAHIFHYPGEETTLPLFAFIFLVALGVDYNIFLMARTREEALRHGTRDGMLRGLAVTGAVITSAGIVLAGTFSTLAVLPLKTLTEIGFTIAFGVLLDTFVVRSVIVPAIVLVLGDRVWWPSRRRAPG